MTCPHLDVERVAVRADRLSLLVRVTPPSARTTTPELARWLARARPTLAAHTCLNDVGPTFGDVMADTPVPHALEHAIIDEQVRLTADSPAADSADAAFDDVPFLGTTEWLDEAEGLARVEVSFHDDLIALEALRTATKLLNDCLAAAAEETGGLMSGDGPDGMMRSCHLDRPLT